MMRGPLLAALAVVLLATAPAAGQAPPPGPEVTITAGGPTVLYAHLAEAARDFYVNPQPPIPAPDVDLHVDGPANTLECLPDGAASQTEDAFHVWHGVLVPGDIVYEDGLPKPAIHHFELYADARLDDGQDATLFWYLSAATPGGEAPAGPTAIPNVQVVATWREAAVIGTASLAWDAGAVVMQGSTTPATLVGDQVVGGDGQVRSVGQVGGRQVYEFAVPLTFEGDLLQRFKGAILNVGVRLDEPTCEDGGEGLMPDLVALHSSSGFRPRTVVNVLNPIAVEYLHPRLVGDEIVLHSSVSTPWGCAAIDPASVQVRVEGPGAVEGLYRAEHAPRPRPSAAEACDFTHVWPAASGGVPGNYSVELTARTYGGDQLVARSWFTVGERAQESPGTQLAPVVAALVAIAFIRGRSQGP